MSLKDLVPKFDPKNIDISLFFMLFEKQALKENVHENNWVSQLIPLLLNDIVQLIVKEPADKGDDYPHIKRLLMQRYKFSLLALKTKFEEHSRKNGMLWADLVYELKVYLDNWLESVKVYDFEDLKELMLTDQVKKRAPLEIRQHYLDVWEDFKTESVLAKKCKALTRDKCRLEFRNGIKKLFEQTREKYVVPANRDSKFRNHERGKSEPKKREIEERKREMNFDRPRAIKC